jgi:hypothetical protein
VNTLDEPVLSLALEESGTRVLEVHAFMGLRLKGYLFTFLVALLLCLIAYL